ncbi:hypothetical protein PF002_g2328 [Phytophthora fragariae]|uniref:Uncharacterized protein n=1 Tax=Phytophthora fragariae TaxID=53985 RepID=A0A6A3M6D0_9STRA|nr:hypothetical protein PF003_g472 [Phytophthora fragariae]KAE9025948.1 hypothetical protein PF011_g2809 [Phytophthora fragariae]KAE9133395.1 hypothetical protein PF007_g3374 [Phytophthora fragariae]KAE9222608.1 hypothetical protein PF004_g12747 [Phytophthora fragariae]KAE9255449.1 hypothetical protein PF002_g2328 [Phytophthora fragariae]
MEIHRRSAPLASLALPSPPSLAVVRSVPHRLRDRGGCTTNSRTYWPAAFRRRQRRISTTFLLDCSLPSAPATAHLALCAGRGAAAAWTGAVAAPTTVPGATSFVSSWSALSYSSCASMSSVVASVVSPGSGS